MNTAIMDGHVRHSDPLQSTAAEWFVRVQNDELSLEEIAEWQRWLGESAEHREAFDRMQELWQGLEGLPDKTPPRLPLPATRLRARVAPHAIAATLLVAFLGALYLWREGELRLPGQSVSFETSPREHREVTLQDGSRLALGGQSLARARFDEEEREVRLERGEAFFDVAKDASRPFVVRVDDATITAIGTAFNVRKAAERIDVTVTEGSVRVARGEGGSATVSAGRQAVLEAAGATALVREAAPDEATSWRSGRLEYLGEPLKYVVADVNRYSTRQITIEDAAVGDLLLTGTVFANDVDAWLRSVEALLPVKVERAAIDEIVLRERAESGR
jgi:transmembrane sensor